LLNANVHVSVQVSIAAVEQRAAALVEPTLVELAWKGATPNRPMSTMQLAQLMFDTQVPLPMSLAVTTSHPHACMATHVCVGRRNGTQWRGRERWRCGCRGWTKCTPRISC
jgi:hypothetical protein